MFCTNCKVLMGDAHTCPDCGIPSPNGKFHVGSQASDNRLDAAPVDDIPPGVRGWSWGAFLFNWVWAVGNRTWIGLLALVPYLGFLVAIWLGFKGREMAWKNKKWDSVEHFNKVQRLWSITAIGLILATIALTVASGMTE